MSRCCQQDALYDAEDAVQSGRALMSQAEAQDLVDGWRELPWWQDRFAGVERVEVYKHRGRGSAGGFEPKMCAGVADMDAVHMCPLFLAHEVSHVLAAARWGSRSHDPAFARTYLELVYLTLGSEAYATLYASFEDHEIDHKGWE